MDHIQTGGVDTDEDTARFFRENVVQCVEGASQLLPITELADYSASAYEQKL